MGGLIAVRGMREKDCFPPHDVSGYSCRAGRFGTGKAPPKRGLGKEYPMIRNIIKILVLVIFLVLALPAW